VTSNERRHVAGWLALPAAAVLNGAVRDATHGKVVSRTASHSIAVAPLVAAILGWSMLLQRRLPLASGRSAALVGSAWLVLTLGFESALGAARRVPLDEVLAEYDVTGGNLWPLVPLAAAAAPEFARRFQVGRGTAARAASAITEGE